jgi:hypothetical protein
MLSLLLHRYRHEQGWIHVNVRSESVPTQMATYTQAGARPHTSTRTCLLTYEIQTREYSFHVHSNAHTHHYPLMQACRAPLSLERLEWGVVAKCYSNVLRSLRAYVTLYAHACEMYEAYNARYHIHTSTRIEVQLVHALSPTLALYNAVGWRGNREALDANCAQSCHWPHPCVVRVDERRSLLVLALKQQCTQLQKRLYTHTERDTHSDTRTLNYVRLTA